MASRRQVWLTMSAAASIPDLLASPVVIADAPLDATAVVTKTRSPNTIGLERARPGIAIFHATFFDAATSHVTGGREGAGATPLASGPLNAGQCCAPAIPLRDTNATAVRDTLSRLCICQLPRSEEHTSELQSQSNLVCRLL